MLELHNIFCSISYEWRLKSNISIYSCGEFHGPPINKKLWENGRDCIKKIENTIWLFFSEPADMSSIEQIKRTLK